MSIAIRRSQYAPVTGKASASTARKAIASAQSVRPFVQASLLKVDGLTEQVTVRVSFADDVICGIPVREDQAYYLVESDKWKGSYYVVALVDGEYRCSSREERVIDRCIAKVIRFRSQLAAA